MPEENAIRGLINQFAVPDFGVKESVLAQLRCFSRERVATILLSNLSSPDAPTVCEAAQLLMTLDAEQFLPPVLCLLKHPNENVRYLCCCLCEEFPDRRAAPRLAEHLDTEKDSNIRWMALHALGYCGTEAEIPMLEHAEKNDCGHDYEGHANSEIASEALAFLRKRTGKTDGVTSSDF